MSRPEVEPTDLVTLNARPAKVRATVILLAAVLLFFTFFAVRWQLGNMLATLTPATDAFAAEIGGMAVSWAPADPASHVLSGRTADFEGAVPAFENAVRLAPNDFRWRIELGRAYEQDDRRDDAEREFRKAVDIAPNFGLPRWSLGNFLLRSERTPEALTELRVAAEKNPHYRDEVFSLIWDYSNKNAARLEMLAGDSPELNARLAYFFAARGLAEDALRSWNRVPAELRSSDTAKSIALGLFEKRYFREALAFAQAYGAETTTSPAAVTNPSFEDPLLSDDTLFGWRIVRSDPKFEAAPDNKVRKEGGRSLRTTFRGAVKAGFANVFQTVVVEPGTRYRISAWVRTENLRTAGPPLLEVINPADASRLGASKPFPVGSADWIEASAEFTAPAGATAITVRTVRVECGEECPITGIVWYDGFRLERL
jgi:tetratricopeptide (TPR) repeat protein